MQKTCCYNKSLPGTYVENTTNVNYSSGNHIFTIVSLASPTAFADGNAIRLNEANVTVGNFEHHTKWTTIHN